MQFRHVPEMAQLSSQQQLIAALLRSDRQTSVRIIEANADDPYWYLALVDTIHDDSIAGLLWDRIHELDLLETVSGIGASTQIKADKLMKDRHKHWYKKGLSALLKEFAMTELMSFERYDSMFCDLLQYLTKLGHKVVFYKGAVLSRTIYKEPQFRLCSDFDILMRPQQLDHFVEAMLDVGYGIIPLDAGFSHQLGVGPLQTIEDMFLVPSDEFVPASVLGLSHELLPAMDLKFDPLERGIRMVELDRFYDQLVEVPWKGQTFWAPSPVDHLAMCLNHLAKDRFHGWKWLYDIHLIVQTMNERQWQELIRVCRREAISAHCWAGLQLAAERLGSPVPQEVLSTLQPRTALLLKRYLLFTVNPLFIWNGSSLPMLLLNAGLSEDSGRKLRVLRQSLSPSREFLERYYRQKHSSAVLAYAFLLMLHWMVLLLPAGIVRRTFGRFVWQHA